jgi:hypothetical protein
MNPGVVEVEVVPPLLLEEEEEVVVVVAPLPRRRLPWPQWCASAAALLQVRREKIGAV